MLAPDDGHSWPGKASVLEWYPVLEIFPKAGWKADRHPKEVNPVVGIYARSSSTLLYH